MNQIDVLSIFEKDIQKDIILIVRKLDADKFLLHILMQQELMFSSLKTKEIEQKETLAEGYSYIINLIVHYKKIKLNRINIYNISDYIEKNINYIDNLINLIFVKKIVSDFKTYIIKQNYQLTVCKNIYKLQHPIKDYKKYYQLGYLRAVIEDHFTLAMSLKHADSNISEVLQKAYQSQMDFHQIMDIDTEYERIRFLISNVLCKVVISINDSNTQYRLVSSYGNYFKNSNINLTDTCTKKGKMTWENLMKVSIGISNLSTFMDRTIKEKCTSKLMFNNSIVYPFSDENVYKTFEMLFHEINSNISEKEIKNFIKKFTTDYTTLNLQDKADIQFKPIVKIMKNTNFILFRTFSGTNLVRAYISNNQQALDDQGDKFEKEVENTIGLEFDDIKDSIKYTNSDGDKGEIDLCFLGDKNIYFVECKNRIHPISASSSINNYEYVMKASQVQLPRAVNYFNEDRKRFIKTNFKKEVQNIEEYSVHKLVILSNRNLSGLNIDDVAIRDIFSLEKTLESGVIEMGIISLKSEEYLQGDMQIIHLWENETSFQEKDLLNYLSSDSKYFKFLDETVAIEQKRDFQYKGNLFQQELYAFNTYAEDKEFTSTSTEPLR